MGPATLAPPTTTTGHARRDVVLVGMAGALIGVLSSTKAIHIDDPLYLGIARQILVDPILPFSAPINWQQITEPTWHVMLSPPGYSSWLAGWIGLGLRSELGWHLAGAVWTVVLALSTYAWARRVGTWPIAATLLVIASPFVVAGQNLMLDVPMLALATSAMVIYLRACERDSGGLAALAGVLAGLAVNVKYAALVVSIVMLLDAALARRRRMVVAGTLGILLFLAGQAASTVIYGEPQILHARDWMAAQWPSGSRDVLHRVSSSVLYLGAGIAWLVLLFGAIVRPWRRGLVSLVVAAAGVMATIVDLRHVEPGIGTTALVHAALFAFSGWFAIAWVVAALADHGFVRRDVMVLAAWTLGFWYFGSVSGPFVAPRSVLPCVLSLVLMIQALTAPVAGPGRTARGAAVALTVALGLVVGVADAEWADVYRKWAPRLVTQYRPERGTIYFLGHWGWQHYAAVAGMTQFDPLATRLIPGDILVFPRNVDYPVALGEVLRGCRIVATESVAAHPWLPRVRDPDGSVFLYGDTRGGRIPWGWSTGHRPLEQFLILRFDG